MVTSIGCGSQNVLYTQNWAVSRSTKMLHKLLSYLADVTSLRLFLPSATKLRRLSFYTCLSFCSQGGSASVLAGIPPPPEQTPCHPSPRTRHPPEQTPPDQAPPGADTPQTRQPLPPRADTPPGPGIPGRRLLLRMLRILLECILVFFFALDNHVNSFEDFWNGFG